MPTNPWRILLLFLFMLSGCAREETIEGDFHNVGVEEFAARIAQGGLLLDVRTPGEYESGHIEGAVLIDFFKPGFASKIGALDRDQPVYVYCRSGGRSAKTAKMMTEMGFGEVTNLEGGYVAWSRQRRSP